MTISFKWIPAKEDLKIPENLTVLLPIVNQSHAAQNVVESLCQPAKKVKNEKEENNKNPVYLGKILSNDVIDFAVVKIMANEDNSGKLTPVKSALIHTSIELYQINENFACVLIRSPTFEKRISAFWGDMMEFLRDVIKCKSIILLGSLSQKAKYHDEQFESREAIIFRECSIMKNRENHSFVKLTSLKELEDSSSRDILETVKILKKIPTANSIASVLNIALKVFMNIKGDDSIGERKEKKDQNENEIIVSPEKVESVKLAEKKAVISESDDKKYMTFISVFMGEASDVTDDLLYKTVVKTIDEIMLKIK